MDWFGMGLLLQFKDQASSGILRANDSLVQLRENAVNTGITTARYFEETEQAMMRFNSLLIGGLGMQQLGNDIMNVSSSLLAPIIGLGEQVISTGSQFEQYRMTLKALYGDAETATAKANEAMSLAAKTPFEVQDVMEALIGFKAINVEALQTFEDINGNARTLLEYVGDLASLRPDVGLQGVLLGVRNLLGGDGGRSLKMRMDIDFQDILGESWGDTSEEILDQLVRASQQIANGLMGELEGTWSQRVSNLSDQFTRFKLAIADGGLFTAVGDSLGYISEAIGSIDDERLARIGTNISNAFSKAWKPIDFVIRKLTDFAMKIIELVETNPMIAQLVTSLLAIGGAVTGIMGAVLVLGGTFTLLVGGLNLFAMQLTKLPTLLRSFSVQIGKAMLSMSKMALVTGGLYVAWKSDFGGIRTILTNFMKNIYTAFTESSRISKLGVVEMMDALEKLDKTTFGGWLTYRLVQIRVFWEALCESWNTNELSDETFLKVQALGLLPLLSTILDLKAKAEAFFKGFKRGWQTVSDFISPILQGIGDLIFWIAEKLFPVKEGVKDVNNEMSYLNLDKWESMGALVGSLTAFGLLGKAIAMIVKPFGTLGGIVSEVINKFFSLGLIKDVLSVLKMNFKGLIMFIKPLLGSALSWLGTTIMTLATTTVAFFGGLPVWAIVAIGAVLVGLVALIYKNWEKIKEFTIQKFEEFKQTWKENFDALGQGFSQVCENVKEWWTGVKEWWSEKVEEAKTNILNTFDGIRQGISEKVEAVKGFFTGLRDDAEKVAEKIGGFFTTMGDNIKNAFVGVANGIIDAINWAIRALNNLSFTTPDWLPGDFGGKTFGFNIKEFPHLSTGGYIKDEGLSYLHPNEVVVNDELTQKLRRFLNDNEQPDPSSLSSGFNSISNNTQSNVNKTEDNSVTFSEGSIQITIQGGDSNTQSAKDIAKQVMQELNRELKVRKALNYR